MDKYYTDFGISEIKNKSELKKQELFNLYRKPKKDKGENMPHIQVLNSNIIHQADLLFLPNDDGHKYALVVVDLSSKLCDAVPLKNKSSANVLEAFKQIYKRGPLKYPKRIEVDPGTEFKGDVKEYFEKQGIFLRYGKPGRHRQQAQVERYNQILGKTLFHRMTAQELLTDEIDTHWVSDLPIMIKAINAKVKKEPKTKFSDDPVCEDDSCNLLEIGTKVRVILEEPIELTSDKRLTGKFREGDIRWDMTPRTIREILIKPGFPPMYLLDGKIGKRNVEPVSYTKNQLQVVHNNEQPPLSKVLRGNPKNFIVEKIVGKKKQNNIVYYEVKWKGFEKTTWESRKNLIQSVPDMLQKYEKYA